jgi:hypothetical protein
MDMKPLRKRCSLGVYAPPFLSFQAACSSFPQAGLVGKVTTDKPLYQSLEVVALIVSDVEPVCFASCHCDVILKILLANLHKSSRSTIYCASFASFFAFKEGMVETHISALLSSPTVTHESGSPQLMKIAGLFSAEYRDVFCDPC